MRAHGLSIYQVKVSVAFHILIWWYLYQHTDPPFSLIGTWSSPRCPFLYHSLVHSKNNSYFVGIGPICDVDLTCIFLTCFFPFYVVSKIGLSTITHILIHICFQMLLSWHWIMFCTLFWCRIRNNVRFECLYLFTLHQHIATSNEQRATSNEQRATSNSAIQQNYHHII